MKPFQFSQPTSIKQALAGKTGNAAFIAGSTNLLDLMKKQIAEPDAVLDITKALPASIETNRRGISIGAMARNSAIANHPEIKNRYPLVAKAILAGASPQIRNMASTGGNLLQRTRCPYFYDLTTACNKRKPGSGCSAINGSNRMSAIVGWSEQCVAVHPSDLCVALSALDANVVVTNNKERKEIIPFKNFHRLPGNTPHIDNNLPANALIHSIEIPENNFHKNHAYVKLRDRDSYAFALISAAAALHLNGSTIVEARLASGGVAHKPWRWYAAEEFLKGKTASKETFSEAASIAVAETKPLAHNGFKQPMLQGALELALQNCLTI